MAAMAMQAPIAGVMPSMTTIMQYQAPRSTTLHVGRKTKQTVATQSATQEQTSKQSRAVILPDFLALSIPTLRANSSPQPFQAPPTTSSILTPLSPNMLRSASAVTRNYSVLSPISRSFSTSIRVGPFAFRSTSAPRIINHMQQRTLFGNTWGATSNRAMLSHLEGLATNNPGSAQSQNAFYQALLRSNMPEILVERYETGRYATNAACDNAYQKALQRMSATDPNGKAQPGQAAPGSETMQSVGQAVAARYRGGNVGIARVAGGKGEPLHVTVSESLGSSLFKWVRLLVSLSFSIWFATVIFTFLFETTALTRKPGGVQNAEAKPELQTTKFSDVHGCDEAKEELQELVEFLKAPDRFNTLGGKLPKGVLLVGPPGTGKTLLARAVAGEAGVPFFYMSGSEFDEVYVGVGAKRVRDLFNAARSKSPAIIFIDELDAIGSKRHERDAAYAKQTLNQLLTELDGFDQTSKVIIIGATNFPQSLDKALTRPGRFDRNIAVPLPDVRGRIAILKYHLRNIRTAADVDPAIVARGCSGFSGAELENVVNQAAIRASKNQATKVSLEDMIWAKDRILMGAERRSAVIQQKDKVMTAYHEGGHALVAMLTEASMPLYKATIMPRGHALGVTQMLPEMDKVSETKKEMMAQIDVCMGGKVAEELVYGPDNVTTGASSDITNATRIAYMMVTQAGMSDAIGNIDLSSDYARLSGETKKQIENEVRRLVEEGRERALALLTKNREGLDRLAHALVDYETLNKEEMEKVVRGEKLPDKIKVDPNAPVKVPEGIAPAFELPPLPPAGTALPGSTSTSVSSSDGSRPHSTR